MLWEIENSFWKESFLIELKEGESSGIPPGAYVGSATKVNRHRVRVRFRVAVRVRFRARIRIRVICVMS